MAQKKDLLSWTPGGRGSAIIGWPPNHHGVYYEEEEQIYVLTKSRTTNMNILVLS